MEKQNNQNNVESLKARRLNLTQNAHSVDPVECIEAALEEIKLSKPKITRMVIIYTEENSKVTVRRAGVDGIDYPSLLEYAKTI